MKNNKTLSMVIPVYNEALSLKNVNEFKPHRGAKPYRLEQNSVKIHLIKTKLMIKSVVK